MNLLYGHKVENTQVYTYQINCGGEFGVEEDGEVKIIFVDGKFERAHFPFCGHYTRNGWRILREIEEEISRIEKEKDNAGNTTQD